MVRRVLVLVGFLSLLAASPVTAASSQTTLQVSARAVASLSFTVIEEPSHFRIRQGKDIDGHDRRSKDRSDLDDEDERASKERTGRDDEDKRRQSGQTSVRERIVVSVTTNSSNGYALQFQAAQLSAYRSARIKIKGIGTVTLRPGESAQLPVRKLTQQADVRTITVVLKISSKAKPGRYPWPINVSAIPL